jgi:diphosphoinositol-polyphosphate diphosphatase
MLISSCVTYIHFGLSGRKRKWFTVEDALEQLSLHKPVQLAYLQSLLTCQNDKVT